MNRHRSSADAPALEVVSEPLRYPSRSGLKIAASWDHGRREFERCPFVVVTPKYGESKKNNLQLGYLLAANGLNVIRFDHSCHVGESAGTKTGFTLPGAVGDILGTLDFLQERFDARSVALVANSLSARTAIRAAALDGRISQLVSVVGLVNLQHSLHAAYREDLVTNHLAGKRWGVSDILGHEVDFDSFLRDACSSDMHDLRGTVRDLEKIRCPVVFFTSADDVWVDAREVQTAIESTPRGSVEMIDGIKHEILEKRATGADIMSRVVSAIVQEAWGLEQPPAEIRAPSQASLFAQNRIERDALRSAMPPDKSEVEFWTDYLRASEHHEHVGDFCEYLNLIGDLTGPFKPGELVLDAGCGSGLFGAWLMQKLKPAASSVLPPTYIGLDLTDSGLLKAMTRHAGMSDSRVLSPTKSSARRLDLAYARADFNRINGGGNHGAYLRFADGMFDAICCSLVIAYLAQPVRFLRELRRLLRPGGRVVVSSMKPHADVSALYCAPGDREASSRDAAVSRDLLRAAGKVKLMEEQGLCLSYSGDEIARLLVDAGFREARVFSSFGDQAHVVRADG